METITKTKARRSDAIFSSEKEKNDFHNNENRKKRIERDERIISLEKQITLIEYKLSEAENRNTKLEMEIAADKKINYELATANGQLKEMLATFQIQQPPQNPPTKNAELVVAVEHATAVQAAVVTSPENISVQEGAPRELVAKNKIMFGWF